MGVKHVFAATFGGIVSALLGGFLVAPIMLLVHPDDGIIGWGLLDPVHAPVRGCGRCFFASVVGPQTPRLSTPALKGTEPPVIFNR